MGAAEEVRVLAISAAEEDFVSLQHVFSHSKWRFDRVHTLAEAVAYLRENDAAVVISPCELPDGNWKTVLSELVRQPQAPRLIVYSDAANDRLWAEVLDHGGYDLVRVPFEAGEIVRVVSLAWRQWKDEWLQRSQGAQRASGRRQTPRTRNAGGD